MVWLAWAAGCSARWGCVSDAWVVDSDGDPVEACVQVRDRGTCEQIVGHPTFAGSCDKGFPASVSDCPGFSLTDAAKVDLVRLDVVGVTEVGIPACGRGPDATGDTAHPYGTPTSSTTSSR